MTKEEIDRAVDDFHKSLCGTDYDQGDMASAFNDGIDFAKKANDWQPIERDKSGFAKEECLKEMFSNLPIEVYDYMDLGDEGEWNDVHYIDSDNAIEWRGDIDTHPKYTHWRKFNAPK